MNQLLRIGLAIVLFLYSALAIAQQTEVSGIVSADGDNAPLPGVNVSVKGTATGTQTNAEGQYKLRVSSGTVLVFSFIGYFSQEITIGTQTSINVSLKPDSRLLFPFG